MQFQFKYNYNNILELNKNMFKKLHNAITHARTSILNIYI